MWLLSSLLYGVLCSDKMTSRLLFIIMSERSGFFTFRFIILFYLNMFDVHTILFCIISLTFFYKSNKFFYNSFCIIICYRWIITKVLSFIILNKLIKFIYMILICFRITNAIFIDIFFICSIKLYLFKNAINLIIFIYINLIKLILYIFPL